jgi:hypothetical protein
MRALTVLTICVVAFGSGGRVCGPRGFQLRHWTRDGMTVATIGTAETAANSRLK